MASAKTEEELLSPVTEETETPCSYSNRSLTLPQATGKMSMCAWEGLCTYVHAWVAGVCVSVFVCVCVCVRPWPMGRRLWQACLLAAFFGLWIRELIILQLRLSEARLHAPNRTLMCTRAHTAIHTCMHTHPRCTFTNGHSVGMHAHSHARTHT